MEINISGHHLEVTQGLKDYVEKKVRKLEPDLTFYQSKLETFKDHEGKEWVGYDYYAKKN